MSAKRGVNKKLKAGKRKPKKVKLVVRVSEKAFNDLSAEEQAEPLAFEPQPKNIFEDKKQKKNFADKKQKNNFTKKEKVDYKKIERDKRLIMWTGVVFFMVLICSVWIFNLKNVFRTNQIKNTNSFAVEEWDKIADDFSQSWAKVKQGMNELKDETTESGKDIFSEIATSSNDANKQDEIDELKKRLEELENKLGGEQATSTP